MGRAGCSSRRRATARTRYSFSALDQTTGAIKWYTQIAPQYRSGPGVPRTRRALPSVTMAPWRSRRRPIRCPASWSSANGAGSFAAVDSAVDGHRHVRKHVYLPATMGAPIVDGDGVIYVQYAVRQIPYPATSIASQLSLLKILPDGTPSTVELATSTEANLFPGSLLPDGNGGVLATWTVVKISSPLEPEPYKAAHLSSAGTILNTYTMPYSAADDHAGAVWLAARAVAGAGRGRHGVRGVPRTTSCRSTSRPAQRTGTTWPGDRSRSSATMPPPA